MLSVQLLPILVCRFGRHLTDVAIVGVCVCVAVDGVALAVLTC